MSAFVGREQDLEKLTASVQNAVQGRGSVVFVVGEAGIGKTTLVTECLRQIQTAFPNLVVAASGQGTSANVSASYLPWRAVLESLLHSQNDAVKESVCQVGAELLGILGIARNTLQRCTSGSMQRLRQQCHELQSQWDLLSLQIARLDEARILETKPEEQIRLEFTLKKIRAEREQIDRRLNEIEAQLPEQTAFDQLDAPSAKEVFQMQVFAWYTQVLHAAAAQCPLVLFVDDLHWADESSIKLLFHLARNLQEQRVFIVGTYRPTDIVRSKGDQPHPLQDVVHEMHRYHLCQDIPLDFLTQAQIRGFLQTSQYPCDEPFIRDVYDLTHGNPFYITELMQWLQMSGKMFKTNVGWTLRGTLHDPDFSAPQSVTEIIAKRMAYLPEETRRVLQYASIEGAQFHSGVLARLLNQDKESVIDHLSALAHEHRMIQEVNPQGASSVAGMAYQFVHALTHKAVYQSRTMNTEQRQNLHANAAAILEELYQANLDDMAVELLRHWERGGQESNAGHYALLCARKANRQAGYQEARAYARKGLELLTKLGYVQAEQRVKAKQRNDADQAMVKQYIELLLEHAAAEEALGEAKNSIEHAETAAKLVEMVEDQGFQGDVFYQVGNILHLNGATNLEVILQILEKSLAIKISTKDQENAIKVLEKMPYLYMRAGKGNYFLERSQELIHQSQQTQQVYLNIAILKLIAEVFFSRWKHQEAYDNIADALRIALTIDNPIIQVELLERAVTYRLRLDIAKASEHYEHAKKIVEAIIDPEIKTEMLYKLGSMAWNLSRYDDAFEYSRILKEAAHSNRDLKAEGRILAVLIGRYRAIGKFEEAIQYGEEYLQAMKKQGKVSGIIGALHGLARSFRHQGNYDKALEKDFQVITLSREYGRQRALANYFAYYADDLRAIGKFKEAIESLTEAREICQRVKDVHWEMDCLTHLAICHFFPGHTEDAVSTMNKAMLLNQTIHSDRLSILISLRYSLILIGTGHYRKAFEVLEEKAKGEIERREPYTDLYEHLINSAELYLAFDQPAKALERLYQVEEYFKKFALLEVTATLHNSYAQVYLVQGDLAKAEISLNEAITLFQQMNSFRLGEAYLTLSALRLAQQQPTAALQCAADARAIFEPIEYYRRGEAILWEAKAYLGLRDFPSARARLTLAAAEFDRLRQPHHRAAAKLVEAQLLRAESGDNMRALNLLNEAKATFGELGLKRLQKETEKRILEVT